MRSLSSQVRSRGWKALKSASRPLSRVLYGAQFPTHVTAIPLGRPLPAASSNQPGRRSEDRPCAHSPGEPCRVAPIRFCSRWGLPCRACYQPRGALLPHRFTLATGLRRGGLFSVALSLGSPPPDVIRHRVSLEPGLSSARTRGPDSGRPADWPGRSRRTHRRGQWSRFTAPATASLTNPKHLCSK
jgi:hypothetical protein